MPLSACEVEDVGPSSLKLEVSGATKITPEQASNLIFSAIEYRWGWTDGQLAAIAVRVPAAGKMRRVLRPDGFLAFYVWDYPSGGMGFIDAFWKVAAEIDARAAALDEGPRFPFCPGETCRDLSRFKR